MSFNCVHRWQRTTPSVFYTFNKGWGVLSAQNNCFSTPSSRQSILTRAQLKLHKGACTGCKSWMLKAGFRTDRESARATFVELIIYVCDLWPLKIVNTMPQYILYRKQLEAVPVCCLCIPVSVCPVVNVCSHPCVYMRTCTHIHVYVHMYAHSRVYVHMHTCVHLLSMS